MKKLFSLYILIALLVSCQSEDNKDTVGTLPQFSFIESEASGIDFNNALEDDPSGIRNVLSYHHYYNGSGVAVGDINNDGLQDIFLAANEVPNRLYLNKGDLNFEDITESAGINPPNKEWAVGAVMADVNADGWLDIYVCQAGFGLYPDRKDRENLLLINNKDNTFTEKAAEYGINDSNESTSAAFFDYDNDGDLDLYVLNESKYVLMVFKDVYEDLKNPEKLAQASGKLYRNDNGKFNDVTKEAGVQFYGFGLGLVTNDINNDGLTDIYVTNDYSVPDYMFINNGDGTFTDSINQKTKQISFYGMGCDIADINNDAYPEIGVVDMAANDHFRDKTLMASMDVEGFWFFVLEQGYQYAYMFNSLQLNNGNGTFSNIAALAGLLRTDWSWAALFADFDQDGYKDFYVTNGYRRYSRDNDFILELKDIMNANDGEVPPEKRAKVYPKMPEIKDPNYIYRNNGDLTFTLVTEDWNMNQPSYSNGAAYADLDQDGDLDIVVNNIDGPAFLYRNNSVENNSGNYLICRFSGETSADPVYNAKVTIKYGDETQYQEFHPTRGYASSMGQEVHFGLGKAEKIDELKVVWPNGKQQVLTDIEVNQILTLNKQEASSPVTSPDRDPKPFTSLNPDEIGLDFKHEENEHYDFAKEILLPHKQSQQGPALATGDINGDGLEDIFIGGAQNTSGCLYIQNQDGKFKKADSQPWEIHAISEDVAAHFYDADNDGDLDLYIASGGGSDYFDNSEPLQDRIYINFGEKGFAAVNALPKMWSAGSVVKSGDFNGDGYNDLFIGGAAVPGKYPFASRSYILQYAGNKYVDVTSQIAPELEKPGIVKDAVITDINNDDTKDLIVVGEWMGVMVLLNENGKFRNASAEYKTDELKGWWYSIEVADLNMDDKPDIILGNLGLNTKFSASKKKPFNVFANDFDKNGSIDIVLSKEYHGKLVPARGRQCSSEQMPYIKSKFPTFKEFASSDLEDIYGEKNLEEALHLQVNTFKSQVLINEGNSFKAMPLPILAQKAPINSIIVKNINGDQYPDLIIAGNMYGAEVETPRYDAGTGQVLLGNGDGTFEAVPVWKSGLYAAGNVKNAAWIKTSGAPLLVVANNDDKMSVFRFDAENVSELTL